MKISFDIECTPIEARSFLGLPDLTELHAVYLSRMAMLMNEGASAADLETMIRGWFPDFAGGLEAWRQTMASLSKPKV